MRDSRARTSRGLERYELRSQTTGPAKVDAGSASERGGTGLDEVLKCALWCEAGIPRTSTERRESRAEAQGHDPMNSVKRCESMEWAMPHPLMIREPRQYARLRWAGKNWEQGRDKRKAIGARHVHTLKGECCFAGKIRGRHGCWDWPKILWLAL
jgi:hypothetical protein